MIHLLPATVVALALASFALAQPTPPDDPAGGRLQECLAWEAAAEFGLGVGEFTVVRSVAKLPAAEGPYALYSHRDIIFKIELYSQRNAIGPQTNPNFVIATHYSGIAHAELKGIAAPTLPWQTLSGAILHDSIPHPNDGAGIIRLLSSTRGIYRLGGLWPTLD